MGFTLANFSNRKFYSTKSDIKPKVLYINAKIEKNRMMKENVSQRVVYRWVNNINGKTYIGSSVNLAVRLYKYYSLKHLSKHKTPIHNALLKYGFENFTFEILEYIEKETNPVLREQYYLELLKPEYNILKKAGSLLGFKHGKVTLEKFALREISEETRKNLSLSATGRILTDEDKNKIASKRKGIKLSDVTRAKISLAAANLRDVKVKITNINTNESLEFATLTEAGKSLGVSRTAVNNALIRGKILKKQYKVTSIIITQ